MIVIYSLAGVIVNVVYDTKTLDKSYRLQPPELILKIDNYTSLDIPGELWLTFFDDQLMRSSFYPKDFNAYLKKHRRNPLKEWITNPYVRTSLRETMSGKKGIVGEDRRLFTTYDDWIKKNWD